MTGRRPPSLLAAPPGVRPGKRRIGLLGGSFNPAHAGHLYISREALKRLRLDEVWWLVSPQNPLKPAAGMASLEKRLARAHAVARDRRIRVLDIETRLHTRYTIDTLESLQFLFPQARFVWLMGADNVAAFARWRRWADILKAVPVAIFDRPRYSVSGAMAKVTQRFRHARIADHQASRLADLPPPAWTFVHCPRHPLSATEIRTRDAGWINPG